MYLASLMFLVTVSRNVLFITATLLMNRKKNTIFNAIQQVLKVYKSKGHCVKDLEFSTDDEGNQSIHTILVDNEFRVLQDEIERLGVGVMIVSKNEHVPEVERQNRVIKERVRAIVQTLPYKKLPKKIQVALVQYVYSLCIHEDNMLTNTMDSRTTGGINLGPSNFNGGYKFFSLVTGEILTRRSWTELPIPGDVIKRVEDMSDSCGELFVDSLLGNSEAIVEEQLLNIEEPTQEYSTIDKDRDDDELPLEEIYMADQNTNEDDENNTERDSSMMKTTVIEEEVSPGDIVEEDFDEDNKENKSVEIEETKDIGVQRYNLRPNRLRNYKYSFLSVHAGIKKWGDRAKDAVREELKLFVKEKVFEQVEEPTDELRTVLSLRKEMGE